MVACSLAYRGCVAMVKLRIEMTSHDTDCRASLLSLAVQSLMFAMPRTSAYMSFPPLICKVLEEYSIHPPKNQDLWLGPWLAILMILFPPADNYLVSPQIKTYSKQDAVNSLPDLIIEVAKPANHQPFALRTVLIVEIKNTQHWPNGIDHILRRIDVDTGYEFSKTALDKLYWIAAVGPHWQYGVREEDEHRASPLIDWNHSVHDATSFTDLRALATLVHAL